MDCSPPDSFVHGISQARVLDWVAISFPGGQGGGSSWPRDWTRISCISYIGRQILYCWASRMGWRTKRRKVRRLVWWVGKNSCERTWRERGGQWSGNMRQMSHQRVRDMFRGLMHQDQLSDFSWGLGKSVKMGAGFSSVQFSCLVVSDSLRPHKLQHARPPCPSLTPGVHSDSRPSSRWCHPAISSSVISFYSCP